MRESLPELEARGRRAWRLFSPRGPARLWQRLGIASAILALGCTIAGETRQGKGGGETELAALSSEGDCPTFIPAWVWKAGLGSELVAVTVVDEEGLPHLVQHSDLARLESAGPGCRFFYHLRVESAAELERLLEQLGRATDRLPNASVAQLPAGLDRLPVARKKAIFLCSLLPLVAFHNALLAARRDRLEALQQGLADRSEEREQRFLQAMARHYELDQCRGGLPGLADTLRVLLERVDEIPPPIILAQAAIESGWGASPFCRQTNNLFGQYAWRTPAAGRIPEHYLAAFANIGESLGSYLHNLNTHPAYEQFRRLRRHLREREGGLESLALAASLENYSARGREYVGNLLSLIYQNRLTRFKRVAPAEDFLL